MCPQQICKAIALLVSPLLEARSDAAHRPAVDSGTSRMLNHAIRPVWLPRQKPTRKRRQSWSRSTKAAWLLCRGPIKLNQNSSKRPAMLLKSRHGMSWQRSRSRLLLLLPHGQIRLNTLRWASGPKQQIVNRCNTPSQVAMNLGHQCASTNMLTRVAASLCLSRNIDDQIIAMSIVKHSRIEVFLTGCGKG